MNLIIHSRNKISMVYFAFFFLAGKEREAVIHIGKLFYI